MDDRWISRRPLDPFGRPVVRSPRRERTEPDGTGAGERAHENDDAERATERRRRIGCERVGGGDERPRMLSPQGPCRAARFGGAGTEATIPRGSGRVAAPTGAHDGPGASRRSGRPQTSAGCASTDAEHHGVNGSGRVPDHNADATPDGAERAGMVCGPDGARSGKVPRTRRSSSDDRPGVESTAATSRVPLRIRRGAGVAARVANAKVPGHAAHAALLRGLFASVPPWGAVGCASRSSCGAARSRRGVTRDGTTIRRRSGDRRNRRS